MEAKEVKGAIVVLSCHIIEGQVVIETNCRDYEHFTTLPEVVCFDEIHCAKSGWSSDTNRACYKSSKQIAYKVR